MTTLWFILYTCTIGFLGVDESGQNSKEIFMKNRKFWMGMLVIVLTFGMMFVGCDDGSKDDDGSKNNNTGGNTGENTGISGGGKLTLTGIPAEYNGKYAMFRCETLTKVIVGAQSVNSDTVRLYKISGGSVTLTLLEMSESGNSKAYTGNDTVSDGFIGIFDTDTTSTSYYDKFAVTFGNVDSIEFKNGSSTIKWTSIDLSELNGVNWEVDV